MNLMLYVMIALTCVFIMNIVGIVLVIALLTIPAALATMFTEGLKETMLWATLCSIVFSILGLLMSIEFNVPPGSTVVLVLGTMFIIAMIGKALYDHRSLRKNTN
jgi:zinc transport system permease protein